MLNFWWIVECVRIVRADGTSFLLAPTKGPGGFRMGFLIWLHYNNKCVALPRARPGHAAATTRFCRAAAATCTAVVVRAPASGHEGVRAKRGFAPRSWPPPALRAAAHAMRPSI